MKTQALLFLAVLAFAGVLTLTVSVGAGLMLVLAGGLGAIIRQDYTCRYRGLKLPRRRTKPATQHFPWQTGRFERHRLAA